jgi:hypothetical protein
MYLLWGADSRDPICEPGAGDQAKAYSKKKRIIPFGFATQQLISSAWGLLRVYK